MTKKSGTKTNTTKVEETPIVKETKVEETKVGETKVEKVVPEVTEKPVKKNVRSTSVDHKCPNCSAKLNFNIELQKWKCDYCDSQFTLEELQKRLNNAATSKKNDDNDLVVDDDNTYVQYNCPDCGAEIIADEQTSATFCIYCGNTAILKNKLAGKFKPDYIIPFKKTEEDARNAFKTISKGKPFTPKSFISNANIEKIRGVYIPFWLYDIWLKGTVKISATKVTSWSSGNTHYTKTDYYDVERAGDMKFKRIPVDGSSRFDDALMNTIEPFNYNDLKEYNHAYLSGFVAEKYDIDKYVLFKEARNRTLATGEQVFLDTCKGYSSKIVKSKYLFPQTENCEYVLLPVYMVNVKYEGKYYTFAMNGQTGEFVGNVPISKGKVFIKTFIAFLIAFVGALILSLILFALGGA